MSEDRHHKLDLADVDFSDEAKVTIGLAVKDVAGALCMETRRLVMGMSKHMSMYWRESDGAIVLVGFIEGGRDDADPWMEVVIPAEHWSVRGQKKQAAQ